MEHLTVSLSELLGPFRGCFGRPESFRRFPAGCRCLDPVPALPHAHRGLAAYRPGAEDAL